MTGRHLRCCVVLLAATSALAQPTTTVSIDLSGLDEQTYARIDGLAFEKRLVLRLLEEGMGVVPLRAPADFRVSISRVDRALRVSVAGEVREVELAGGPAQVHLELTHKVCAMLDEARRRAVVPAPAPAPAPAPPEPTPPAPALPQLRPSVEVGGGLLLGDVVRPAVSLGGRLTRGLLAFSLDGAWSPASLAQLSLHEGRVSAQAGVALNPVSQLELSGALGGGVWLHGWDSSFPDDAAPRGLAVLPAWVASARVGWGFTHVVTSVRATVSGHRALVHAVSGVTQWASGPVRLELGLLVEVR